MSLNLDTRQRAMLKEMGVKVWWPTPTEPTALGPSPVTPARARNTTNSEANNVIETGRKPISESVRVPPQVSASPSKPVAASTAARSAQSTAQSTATPLTLQPLDAREVAAMDWPTLQAAVANCQACALCHTRKKTVFGSGAGVGMGGEAGVVGEAGEAAPVVPSVDWLIVGDAPDATEDAAGEPFIGPAGQLLDNMLKAVGTSRASGAFVTNITKCHPPGRNPDTAEIAQCAPYLQRQIALLQPKVIIAMGRFAVQNLLAGSVPDVASVPLGKLRGQVYAYQGVPVVVTYHPAYLLRALGDKGKAWQDLCLAMGVIR
jgi:uracil-DNA glycosylase